MSNDIEEHIISAAKELFFAHGKFNATSQEIADYAQIPRTSINYYFRSVKILYNQVKEIALKESRADSDRILIAPLPFKEKVGALIDAFFKRLSKYPYLEAVVLSSDNLKTAIEEQHVNRPILSFLDEIKKEMLAGHIPTYDPRLFIINLFSLMVYPSLASKLNILMMHISETEYAKLMEQRKEVIMNYLFPYDVKSN